MKLWVWMKMDMTWSNIHKNRNQGTHYNQVSWDHNNSPSISYTPSLQLLTDDIVTSQVRGLQVSNIGLRHCFLYVNWPVTDCREQWYGDHWGHLQLKCTIVTTTIIIVITFCCRHHDPLRRDFVVFGSSFRCISYKTNGLWTKQC